ncbi:MAG: zf-HC2 domain-containing protein [Fimbriimonadales bacterium]|nr:zf-HC2 domain-containing protein [Fimbriimonadales bacterium]
MNCTRYERWLWDELEGRLSAAQSESLRAHLQVCPRCQRQWESAQATYRALRELPRRRAPERIVLQTRARLQQQPASKPAFAWWKRVALAPALGLLVAFGWWAYTLRTPDSSQPPRVAQEQTENWVEVHEQLEVADWSPTPTANYFITTGYTR